MSNITELDPQFSTVLGAVGYSSLLKYRSVRIWRQIDSRLGFIDYVERKLSDYQFSDFDYTVDSDQSALKFMTLYDALMRMKEYCTQCLHQLDINNTIDHLPIGDMSYSLLPGDFDAYFLHKVEPFTPLYRHWEEFQENYKLSEVKAWFEPYIDFPAGLYDDAAKLLVKSTYASRRSAIMSRLNYELYRAHNEGWYFVFDTLTLAPGRVNDFYDTPMALRDYFRSIGRACLVANGLPVRSSADSVYKYFCVPEYGSKEGRLHFHCLHLCKRLPKGSVDPNLGRSQRNRRQVESFRGFWSYGHSMPIAVRYSQDAFTRLGWLWPVDQTGKPLPAKSYLAVAGYLGKYVSKNIDTLSSQTVSRKENQKWNTKISQQFSIQTRKQFRVRMSRTFGRLSSDCGISRLSTQSLVQMMQLHRDVTPFNRVLKVAAKKELTYRLRGVSIADIRTYQPEPLKLLESLRSLMKTNSTFSLQSFMSTVMPIYSAEDISNELSQFIRENGFAKDTVKARCRGSREVYGSK